MNTIHWHQLIEKYQPTITCIIIGALSGASSLIINYFIYFIQHGSIDPNQEFKFAYLFFASVIGVACVIFGGMLGFLMAPIVKSQGKLLIILIFLMPLAFGILGNLVIQSIIDPIFINLPYLY